MKNLHLLIIDTSNYIHAKIGRGPSFFDGMEILTDDGFENRENTI
jgi:hypothetical protein